MTSENLLKTPIPFIMMGLYFITVAVLSFRVVQKERNRSQNHSQNFEDFYTAGKSMPAFVVGLVTIVTFYSGTTFTGRVGFFCNYGVIGLTTLFSSAASGVIMFFLSEKVWPLSKKYHCSTLCDLLELLYQSRLVKLVTASIIICFNIIWLITEIHTLGIIVNIASGGHLSVTAGSVIAASIIIAYVCTGGIRSVAAVDSFSSLFMLAGSVVTVIFLIVKFYHGNIGSMFSAAVSAAPSLWVVSDSGAYGSSYWISSILVSTAVALVYPSNYMSICMGKSVRAVKKAALAAAFSGPWLIIYGLIAAAALGLQGRGIAFHDLEAALLEMVSYSGSGLMLGIITTFVLAASLGTMDSTLISLSGILSNDIVMNLWLIRKKAPCLSFNDSRKKSCSSKNDVALTRILILLLGGIALFLSTKNMELMVLMANYASNGLLQIVPAAVGALCWKKATAAGAIASMISGVFFFVCLDLIKRFFFNNAPDFFGGYFLGIPAFFTAVLVFILVSLATASKPQAYHQ